MTEDTRINVLEVKVARIEGYLEMAETRRREEKEERVKRQEHTDGKHDELVTLITKHMDEEDYRFSRIEDKISVYSTVIKTLKFIGLAVIFAVSFKLGDISGLFHTIFGE